MDGFGFVKAGMNCCAIEFHNIDLKSLWFPEKWKKVHQLLCSPLWSLQLPTTVTVQLVDAKPTCQSSAALSVVSVHIQADEWFSTRDDHQRQSTIGLKDAAVLNVRPHHTFIKVAAREMPRIVPKVVYAPEVKWGEARVWSRLGIVTLQVWALKQDVCFLDIIFVADNTVLLFLFYVHFYLILF